MNTVNDSIKKMISDLGKIVKDNSDINSSIFESIQIENITQLDELRQNVKRIYIEQPQLLKQIPTTEVLQSLIKNLEELSVSPFNTATRSTSLQRNSNLAIIIGRIQSHLRGLENISNLPSDAAKLQKEGVLLIKKLLPEIEKSRTETIQFVDNNLPKLKKAQDYLKNDNISIDTIVELIRPIGNNAKKLKDIVDSVDVHSTQVNIGSITAQSIGIQNRLKNEITVLEKQIKDLEEKKKQAENDKWYYLGLGVFGLIGLGIAIGVIISITNDTNALITQRNAMATKRDKIKNFLIPTQKLNTELQPLHSQMYYLKNNIDFLISSLNSIMTKLLDPSINRTVVLLFVTVSISDMEETKNNVT